MLKLAESERAELEKRFDEITDGFSELDKYDTSGVVPLVTVLDMHNVLREDITEKLFSRDTLLENAPECQDGYFQVPATID